MSRLGVGSSADGAAFCRAVEQYLPGQERVFSDPFAFEIMGGFYQWLLRSPRLRALLVARSERSVKGIYGAQICRTRFIDEEVVAALSLDFRQIVMVGAGLDTRCLRLPGIQRAQVFELDMPRVQERKAARVAKIMNGVPTWLHFVPVDLEGQELGAVLRGSGYQLDRKTFFVWEGVTQYLNAEAVSNTLRFIGGCAAGSRVVFTYVPRWIIEHPERDPEAVAMMRMSKMKLAPFIFGMDQEELPAYLGSLGLHILKDVGAEYYRRTWLEPRGRKMDVTPGERVCLAEVQ